MLKLGLDPGAWRLYSIRDHDPAFAKFKVNIFERDNHTCQYCDFQAFHDMCVVNIDYNYKNNKGSNLITACPFCAQCHFIMMSGSENFAGGTMIFLPEISQETLNSICHVIFCSVLNGSDQAEFFQSIYNDLRLRSNIIEEQLGKGLSDPKFFAQMLIDTPLENKNKIVSEILLRVRLLPSKNGFAKQVLRWSKQSLESMI
jgi:intracellular multiplication protein IcmJ